MGSQTPMAAIRRANADAGRFFFSTGAMEFFHSQIFDRVWVGDGVAFFVTSEREEVEHEPRFSVRVFTIATGCVCTHGLFRGYVTLETASKAAQDAADASLARKEKKTA